MRCWSICSLIVSPKGLNGLGQVWGPFDGPVQGLICVFGTSIVIATRGHLVAKARIVTVSWPAPSLVISRLIALKGGVLHLALTRAARGCARGQGQGNSSPAVTSGWSSPWGLAGIPKLS